MRIFSLLFLILTSLSSLACDCAPRTLDESINGSDNIFSAQVVKQEITWVKFRNRISPDNKPDGEICSCDIDGKIHPKYNFCIPVTVFTLLVETEFKGSTECETITVYSEYNSNCYKNLNTGFKYIFYLSKTDRKDIYDNLIFAQVSDCSRITYENDRVSREDGSILETEYLHGKFTIKDE